MIAKEQRVSEGRTRGLAAREEQDPERVVAGLDVTTAALLPPVLLHGQVRSEPDPGLKNAVSLVKDRVAPAEGQQLQIVWCYGENY